MHLTPAFLRNRLAHRQGLLQILDNIGWLILDKVLRLGIGLGVSVWLARYLGPEKFGLLNFSLAMATFFSAVALLGLRNIVVRDVVRHPDEAGAVLGSAILLQTIGGLTAYGLLNGTIHLLRPQDPQSQLVVAIIGFMLIAKVGEVVKYWFEAQVQSRYTVLAENAMYFLAACIKISLILAGAPLIVIASAFALEFALIAIALFIILIWKGINPAQLKIRLQTTLNLIKDSWPLIFSSMAIMIYMKTDQIMLGQLKGDHEVGLYSAAVKLSEPWHFLGIALVTSVFPSIVKLKKLNSPLYHQRFQALYDVSVIAAITIAATITLFSDAIIGLLFGTSYNQSSTVLKIHIWTTIFVFLGIASSKWLIVENLQVLSMQRTLIGAFINVTLNLFLIPQYSVIGAASATLASQIFAAYLYDAFQSKTKPTFLMKTKSLLLFGSLSRLLSIAKYHRRT